MRRSKLKIADELISHLQWCRGCAEDGGCLEGNAMKSEWNSAAEPKSKKVNLDTDPEHPIQPFILDKNGTLRFKANKIVEYLLDNGSTDLNKIALLGFSKNDMEQFAQLIGYSLSGFGDLSYVSNKTYRKADKKAEKVRKSVKFKELYP